MNSDDITGSYEYSGHKKTYKKTFLRHYKDGRREYDSKARTHQLTTRKTHTGRHVVVYVSGKHKKDRHKKTNKLLK